MPVDSVARAGGERSDVTGEEELSDDIVAAGRVIGVASFRFARSNRAGDASVPSAANAFALLRVADALCAAADVSAGVSDTEGG